MQLRGGDRIRQASKTWEDSNTMALSADDLIAKEAFYHASCYKYYTEVTHAFEKWYGEFDKTVDESDEAFEAVKKKLQELYDDPDIVEFPTIKKLIWNSPTEFINRGRKDKTSKEES